MDPHRFESNSQDERSGFSKPLALSHKMIHHIYRNVLLTVVTEFIAIPSKLDLNVRIFNLTASPG
jgi:hypothetical protein